MSALAADRNTPQMGQGVPQLMNYPVKTGVTIYKGALVVIDSNGYAKPAVSETGDIAVGRSLQQVAAGALASGTYTVQVEQGVFKWAVNGTAVSAQYLGSLCYAYDDQTVTLSSSAASIAGTVYGFDASGTAWVYTGLAAPIDGSSVTTVSNNLAALKSNMVWNYTIPITLSAVVTASTIVARFTPGMSGTITKLAAYVIKAPTTTACLATFTPNISGAAITGGVLAVTSTSLVTTGASVSGTAVTGSNTFTAAQEITIVPSAVTVFVEGNILLELFMQSA